MLALVSSSFCSKILCCVMLTSWYLKVVLSFLTIVWFQRISTFSVFGNQSMAINLQGDFMRLHIIPALLSSADEGDKQAQWLLGQMYTRGEGMRRDPERGFKWTRKAAEQNVVEAQEQLARFFLHGFGCEKNPQEAFVWRTRAWTMRSISWR